jgi:hypothetical protein
MSRPRNARTPGPVVNGGLIDFETNGLTSAYAAEGAYYPCPQAINAPMLAYGGATMMAPMQQQPGASMLAPMQQQQPGMMMATTQYPGGMMMAPMQQQQPGMMMATTQYPGGVMMAPMQPQYPSSYGMLAAQPAAPKEEGLSSASNEVLSEKERIRQNVRKYMSQRNMRHASSDDDEMSEALHSDLQDRVDMARRRYMQAKLGREPSSTRLSSDTRLDRMEAELSEARERWRQRSSALSSRAHADRADDELQAARERWMQRGAAMAEGETAAGRIAKLNAEARQHLKARPMSAQERVLSRRY